MRLETLLCLDSSWAKTVSLLNDEFRLIRCCFSGIENGAVISRLTLEHVPQQYARHEPPCRTFLLNESRDVEKK